MARFRYTAIENCTASWEIMLYDRSVHVIEGWAETDDPVLKEALLWRGFTCVDEPAAVVQAQLPIEATEEPEVMWAEVESPPTRPELPAAEPIVVPVQAPAKPRRTRPRASAK